ncbi:MAG: hypothetical protein ACI30R_04425 [Sodaliphilus sp.]
MKNSDFSRMLCLKITKLRQIAWSEKLKNQKRTKTKTKTKTLFAKSAIKGTVLDGIFAVSQRANPQKNPPSGRCKNAIKNRPFDGEAVFKFHECFTRPRAIGDGV